ncbi:hypothetical protein GJ689_09460 [Rhodoplanes serenus]|jgi:hypothetical protein|uniref:Uncharacterized protein n=1 Tax=Rhodoplanes serenus TaxID=200615 RepID=A0A327KA23_9BRAD|nr:hypothetical protein [Rhodoplanes serenus]MTW16438.1 hypothetical protein [Rhodoplanes serenus]RAI35600.1 hypothetical protein CH340_05560 [Rhodoplanes serenus]VCU11648.1 hypothetical protein RHODGE_RHODGE_04862 [Rhodoplanes serenus]
MPRPDRPSFETETTAPVPSTEHGRRTAEHAGSGRRTARTGGTSAASDRSALQYCVDNDLI